MSARSFLSKGYVMSDSNQTDEHANASEALPISQRPASTAPGHWYLQESERKFYVPAAWN